MRRPSCRALFWLPLERRHRAQANPTAYREVFLEASLEVSLAEYLVESSAECLAERWEA
jgi:hypothetical protein